MIEMIEDERKAWLEWRRQGLGASDVANIIAGSYGGLYAVVADKLGLLEEQDATPEMERGLAWEARIADAIQALTGLYVVGEQAWVAHRGIPHHRATVDGFLHNQPEASISDVDVVLEIKTQGMFVRTPWERHEAQVRWQMHVTDCSRALIAVATIDDDESGEGEFCNVLVRWVERDPVIEAEMIEAAENAWGWITKGELPPPETASALELVKKLNATVRKDADAKDLTEVEADVIRLSEIKAAIKTVEDEAKALEARIRHFVGDASKGTTPAGWKVSVSAPRKALDETEALKAFPLLTKTVLDKDAVLEAHGKTALDPFKFPVGARSLTITKPKDFS